MSWNNTKILRRIHEFDNGIKLLVTFRNPVDRAISIYHHFKKPNDPSFEVSLLCFLLLKAFS